MALNPADIPTVSRLLDDALALEPAQREPWLAALATEHQRHAGALRDMLAQQAALDTDSRLHAMPTLPTDEAVAHAHDLVGPYRLLREIGRGGMGSVWLAERADGAYKRQVALKLPRLAWGAGLAERMAREREIGMLLEHPNIARLYDAGVDERGRPFLALEFVDGQAIDAWCEAQGLTTRERLRMFVQVVKAVAYAHGRLVVHRDLKPSNVLVTPDGQAHLLDFGIAKLLLEVAPGDSGLTQEQGRVLTPHYASPEQVAGEAITVQSDVYSLGVLLYELLTGTLPIAPKRRTLGAIEDAILEGDAPLASSRGKDHTAARALRGEVDAILVMAMQREPARRYATADALALDIERYLNDETVMARPDSLSYRSYKLVRRHWVGVSALSAVLVAILVGTAVAVAQAQRAARSGERERVVKAFVTDMFRINLRGSAPSATSTPLSPDMLVEQGASLIQARFTGQPELQAELYGVVGRVFANMGAYRQAADYASRETDALALMKAEPRQRAPATFGLAQALLEEGRPGDAEPHALRAVELAYGDEGLLLDAMALLARVQMANGGTAASHATLDRLDRLLSRDRQAFTAAGAWATALRAEVLQHGNKLNEAYPVYLRAVEHALAAEGSLSEAAIAIRLMAADWYRQTGEIERVNTLYEPAVAALHARGGPYAVRASLEVAKHWWQLYATNSGISFAKAREGIETARRELGLQSASVPKALTAQVDFWLGGLLTQWGNYQAGGELIDLSAAQLLATAQSPRERFHLVGMVATSAQNRGQHSLADQLSREQMELRRRMGRDRHPYFANAYIALALNLGMSGRFAEADAVLQGTPIFEPFDQAPNPQMYNNAVREARARLQLDHGNAAAALALLPARGVEAQDSVLEWSAYSPRAIRGEALCALGKPREGLTLMEGHLVDLSVDHYEHDPRVAWHRANTGVCALQAGDTGKARRYATQARAAFTAQPGVSPYFKAPLVKLERALGLNLPPV